MNVPEQWRITDTTLTPIRPEVTTHADDADTFELRTLRDDVFIAVKSQAAYVDITSQNKFKFRLQSPVVLVPLEDTEWSSADLVPSSSGEPIGLERRTSDVKYRGKIFPFSGKDTCPTNGASLSPDGRWLAIQSADTTYHPNDLLVPPNGTLYVDISDVNSGKRRFQVSAKIEHQAPCERALQVRWIWSSFLFIDVFEDKQKFILCNAAK